MSGLTVSAHQQMKDKQNKNLEEVIFYLQDEIANSQKTAAIASAEAAALKQKVAAQEAANAQVPPTGDKPGTKKSDPTAPKSAAGRRTAKS